MNDKEFEAHLDTMMDEQNRRSMIHLEEYRNDAAGWLESRGLPTTPEVRHDGYIWRLPYYIGQCCKGANTTDILAGEVVNLFSGLDGIDPRIRESHIIKLMIAQTKLAICHERGKTNANSARLDRSKPWAKALAAELVDQFDNFSDAWRSLRKRARKHSILGEYAGYEIELDLENDTLTAEDEMSLKRESFRTGEFRKAKAN